MSNALLDMLPEPALLLDGDGNLLHWNPAAQPMLSRAGLDQTQADGGEVLPHLAAVFGLGPALQESLHRVKTGGAPVAILHSTASSAAETGWWEISISRCQL